MSDEELAALLRAYLDTVDEYVDRICTPEYIERTLAEIKDAVARERARAAAARASRRPTYVAGPLVPCSRTTRT
jgi:glutaredoxin 2